MSDEFCLMFEDMADEPRTPDQMEAFVDEMREVAREHDFKLRSSGDRTSFARFVYAALNPDGTYKELP